jgi:hypothetical protein
VEEKPLEMHRRDVGALCLAGARRCGSEDFEHDCCHCHFHVQIKEEEWIVSFKPFLLKKCR